VLGEKPLRGTSSETSWPGDVSAEGTVTSSSGSSFASGVGGLEASGDGIGASIGLEASGDGIDASGGRDGASTGTGAASTVPASIVPVSQVLDPGTHTI
jgi:hypothetical protein